MTTTPHQDPRHGRPGKLEGYSPLDLRGDAFGALVRRLGPKRAMLDGAANASEQLWQVGTSVGYLYGQDDIYVDDLQPGQGFYGGYWNGTFANLTALRAWIKVNAPKASLLTVTPNGENGAMCGDWEPGCIWPITTANVGAFLKNADHGGGKPWIYTSAGNATTMVKTYRAVGFADADVIMWTAHYTGVAHFCGPKTCGYGLRQADATQYNDGTRDYDIAQKYCFPSPPAPPVPADWSYPAPKAVSSVGGSTSFRITWLPNLAGHPVPDHYVLWVYRGSATAANLVAEYGPKNNIPGSVTTFEGGGLETGVKYVAHLAASGPGTTRLAANTFAAFTFTTA
jgi:hypothetical protein